MQAQIVFAALIAVFKAAEVLGQAATTTSNPLNQFIDDAQSGAGAINSAISAQSTTSSSTSSSSSIPSSTSTTPTATPTTSSAASATSSAAASSGGGLSDGARIGIIVGCVLAAVFLIGLLAGICCCVILPRRRRRRAVSPEPDEEVKAWTAKPSNPGRNYSPLAAHGGNSGMEQQSNMPLMTAGAIPHGNHSQAPSLSQHPAMRDHNENPFADNVYGTQHSPHSSHHGIKAAAAGATAAGGAGYGAHNYGQVGAHQPGSHAPPLAQNQHHGLPPGLAAATVGSGANHSMRDHHHHHHHAGAPYPVSNVPVTPTNRNGLGSHPGDGYNNNLNALPSTNRTSSASSNNLGGAGAGAATASAATASSASYGPQRSEENKHLRNDSGSRSRSHSRHPSGGLPTHNDANRPPTPFGLSGIGQPYESMHVHVLQNESPSRELRRSFPSRENTPLATGTNDDSGYAKDPYGRGHVTTPQVPSRSPHRDGQARISTNNSYESFLSNEASTSSNSEQYQATTDPYQPAHPNRGIVAPWEHRPRYSGTPPTSASINPPPVPWETDDYQRQRRHSHSPRQSRGSFDANGRRVSQSPGAVGINGQPRRLRFEDLQAGNNNSSYPGTNQRDSYDDYDHIRWSQGVGEAL